MLLCLFLVLPFFSWLLTGIVLRCAPSWGLIDLPNLRSSHRNPTPRGGGLAFVLSFLLGLPFLAWAGLIPWSLVRMLAGAGGVVALIGFLDDRGHVPVGLRLAVHFLAVAFLLIRPDGPPIPVPFGMMPVWAGTLFLSLALVWFLNLYNFMDGIDGIAGIEAVSVGLGGALLWWFVSPGSGGWTAPLLLAAAVAGFLAWNLPPARIFMGDVGSGFLGLTLGALGLAAAEAAPQLFWSWLILVGLFVVDASLTLIRRVLRGEKFHQAHRSHAYQQAADRFGAHRPVSLAVGAINLFWLLPLALLVAAGRLGGLVGLLVAYGPLLGLAVAFGAGREGPPGRPVSGEGAGNR